MSDFVMLVCAVLASTAFGILVAYWVCVGMFRVFRLHAEQTQVAKASVSIQAIQG